MPAGVGSWHGSAEFDFFAFSLLQNSPNDLQMLSDAPAHHVFCLFGPLKPTGSEEDKKQSVVLPGSAVCRAGRSSTCRPRQLSGPVYKSFTNTSCSELSTSAYHTLLAASSCTGSVALEPNYIKWSECLQVSFRLAQFAVACYSLFRLPVE